MERKPLKTGTDLSLDRSQDRCGSDRRCYFRRKNIARLTPPGSAPRGRYETNYCAAPIYEDYSRPRRAIGTSFNDFTATHVQSHPSESASISLHIELPRGLVALRISILKAFRIATPVFKCVNVEFTRKCRIISRTISALKMEKILMRRQNQLCNRLEQA